MGKDGGGLTAKAISNKIKAKGLQRLRWYCQFCQKQCRDENGFKCHIQSSSHMKQMEVVSTNTGMFINNYSRDFEAGFMKIVSRQYTTSKVLANQVYNEYIQDRHHIHMNATQWSSLSEFIKYLGRESKCLVEETPRGWLIQYIDRDPAKIAKKMAENKKEVFEITEEQRLKMNLEKQLKEINELYKDNDKDGQDTIQKPTSLTADQLSNFKININLNQQNNQQSNQNNNEPKIQTNIFNQISTDTTTTTTNNNNNNNNTNTTTNNNIKPLSFSFNNSNNNNNNNLKPKSSLDEIMEKQMLQNKIKQQQMDWKQQQQPQKKEIANEESSKGAWLYKNIVVKIIDKSLTKYYKQKGVVVDTEEDGYVAKLKLIEEPDVYLKIDQTFLETVIPSLDQTVLIVDGRYRGNLATLDSIDVNNFDATLTIQKSGQTVTRIPYEYFSKYI